MKFESDYIEKLAKIIADNDLTEISLEDGEQAITIRKDLPEVNMVASAPAVASTTAPAAAPAYIYKWSAPEKPNYSAAQIRALTGGDITKEREVLKMDCWRALTELDAKAKDYEDMRKTAKP